MTDHRQSPGESETPVREQDKVMLRLPDGMRDRLKEAASDNKRSMNAEIVDRLGRSFELDQIIAEAEAADRRAQFAENRGTFLPEGLDHRIRAAAESRGRTKQEEIIQALEAAFPPPPPFSLDWFHEEWITRIAAASDEDRPALVEQANALLQAQGLKYEVRLGDENGYFGGVVFGPRDVLKSKASDTKGDK